MVSFGYGDILVSRQNLQDFAWSAPMRDLAERVGVSDVGLKKLLISKGLVTPPQGHWNKLHAGKPVLKCPRVPARRPGEIGRAHVDRRFASLLPAVEPMPSAGPFVSAAVPEDLDELYEQELKAIGRVAVPRKLERYHHALAPILKQEERRRAKFAISSWQWDAPKFDNPVDRRRLRLLNAIFMTLSRRGQSADAYERDGEVHVTATIGDTRLRLSIEVAGKHRSNRSHGSGPAVADLPGSTPLKLSVDAQFEQQNCTSWDDNAAGTLETKIVEIVARTITLGEAKFRRGLKEAEERAKQFRQWQAQQGREELERRNAERLKKLRKSGELLRQAEDLRALIVRVRSAMTAGLAAVDPARLEGWEQWASAEADRLDPLLSGQIMTHLASIGE